MAARPKTKLPYYNFDYLYSFDALYSCVVGGRGIGKTYGAIKRSIQRYLKHGEQFIYLRRYKPEIVGSKMTFFNAVAVEFPDYEFRVNGNLGQMRSVLADDDSPWDDICYFVTLANAQSLKGASFAQVHTIIFDEFIIERGLVRYLPNEVDVFNNFFLTVDRFQDRVRALLLANSVSIDNPYFVYYNIQPKVGQNVVKAANGEIVSHFPDADEFANAVYQTRFGRLIKDTEYADYVIGNSFEDNHEHFIGNKSSSAVYRFTIKIADGSINFWHDIYSGAMFATRRGPRGGGMVYVLDPSLMRDGHRLLPRNSPHLTTIRGKFSRGLLMFDSQRTRTLYLRLIDAAR